jgi:hypothetical protein
VFAAGEGVTPFLISGNYFESTGIDLISGQSPTVSGNTFYLRAPTGIVFGDATVSVSGSVSEATVVGNTFTDKTDTTHVCIMLYGAHDSNVLNNAVEGFGIAIQGANFGAVYPTNCNISGNVCKNQYTYGIIFAALSEDCLFSGNVVSATDATHAASNTWVGINGGGLRGLITGNAVRCEYYNGGCVLDGAGSSSHTGACITNNKCFTGSSLPIRVTGYNFVSGNFINGSVYESGGHTTVGTNYTIA